MTRAVIFPRFKGRKPEELPELLERLVEELRAELASLRNARTGAWNVHPTVIGSTTAVTDLTWQTGFLCDSTGGDISVRMPYGRRDNIGQRVAIIKTAAGNNVIVYGAGGQYVTGAASQSVSADGVREYMWTGDGSTRGWRLVT
jgi:hypothetical protein